MKKKTIEVDQIKNWVNFNLANTRDGKYHSPESRYALCTLLEHVLHETGNYKGYWTLRPDEVPVGEKPGIIFDESPDHNHVYPDDSRRRYY